jgi:lambda family phage tail tape measure protein
MATVDKYVIDIEVSGKQSVDTLKQSVIGLGSALAGIGFASFIHGAMEFADQLDDLAKSVGLSTERVLAFQKAVTLAGGKSADAGKMITTFYQTLSNAADGGEQAQDALEKLGITLGDLQSKSEQQLLNKAVESLAQMEAGASRTAAATEVFGKAVKQIDPKQLQEALNKGTYEEAAKAIEKAAEANEKLEVAMGNLKLATLQVLEPFLGDLDNMEASIEQMKVVVATLGAAIAATFAYKTVAVIGEIVLSVIALTKAMRGAAIASATLQAMAGPAGWVTLAAGATAAVAATIALNKALDDTVDAKEKSADASEKEDKAQKAAFANAQKYSKQEQQARAQAVAAAKEQTRVMGEQNRLANDYRQTIINTMGIDANRAALITANATAEKDAQNQILEIDKKIVEEKAKGRGTNQEVIDQLEKQKTQIGEQLDKAKALNQEEYNRKLLLAEQARNLALVTQMTKDDIFDSVTKYDLLSKAQTQEVIGLTKRNDAEIAYQATLAGTIKKMESLSKVKVFEGEDFNTLHNAIKELKDLPTEKALIFLGPAKGESYEKHRELINQVAKDEARLIAQIKSLTKDANQEEVADLLNTMNIERDKHWMTMTNIKKEEDAMKKRNQSMVEGSKAAFDQIAQSMTPFARAQAATNAMWGRMSTAIDNFVDTGKFKFSDLASSIIKDLIKIEMKAQMMELWQMFRGGPAGGGTSGGGGGGSGLGSLLGIGMAAASGSSGGSSMLGSLWDWGKGLLGFADGGQPPMNKASIVGENGPELFVPRSAGTVIPNNQLGGGGQTVNNYYTTNVNNTVSALDAKSVAQLFSENKKTLFGVVESARREVPMRG